VRHATLDDTLEVEAKESGHVFLLFDTEEFGVGIRMKRKFLQETRARSCIQRNGEITK
jgi:hypothetical protein